MIRSCRLALVLGLSVALPGVRAAEPAVETYAARDTLGPQPDDSPDARACVDGFCWKAGAFEVTVKPSGTPAYERILYFPSPFPTGDEFNDRVSLEWYFARDAKGAPRGVAGGEVSANGSVPVAPAVLVIHESGSGMEAGRMFARALRNNGLHAFLIHLPYYGERRGNRKRPDPADLMAAMRQGIADVRRARDALAAIPQVQDQWIAVQGTSLGGFVATTAASLDGCFDATFIMLAGGDLYDMVMRGKQDTQKLRERLAAAGIEGDELKDLLRAVEPTRVAHRLDARTTWLYSALQDDVVPIENGRKLAEAARLHPAHHVQMPGGHYTGVLFFPIIVDHMVRQIDWVRERPEAGASAGGASD
jgi:dienelactone hydrolase